MKDLPQEQRQIIKTLLEKNKPLQTKENK
jgi:hypothetical protein